MAARRSTTTLPARPMAGSRVGIGAGVWPASGSADQGAAATATAHTCTSSSSPGAPAREGVQASGPARRAPLDDMAGASPVRRGVCAREQCRDGGDPAGRDDHPLGRVPQHRRPDMAKPGRAVGRTALATWNPAAHASAFRAADWPYSWLATLLDAASVLPDGVGRFTFGLTRIGCAGELQRGVQPPGVRPQLVRLREAGRLLHPDRRLERPVIRDGVVSTHPSAGAPADPRRRMRDGGRQLPVKRSASSSISSGPSPARRSCGRHCRAASRWCRAPYRLPRRTPIPG